MPNIFGRPFLPKFFVKCSLFAIGLHSSSLFAQVDAGALQRGLEQQLPLPSPLTLPEPTTKEGERTTKGKVYVNDPDKVMPCQSVTKDECSKS